jgi:hypothetical protein
MYHCMVLTECGKIYTWGRGNYGVLGNGSNKYSLVPELNEELEIVKVEENLALIKIDAADEYSAVLTGKIYVLTLTRHGISLCVGQK